MVDAGGVAGGAAGGGFYAGGVVRPLISSRVRGG